MIFFGPRIVRRLPQNPARRRRDATVQKMQYAVTGTQVYLAAGAIAGIVLLRRADMRRLGDPLDRSWSRGRRHTPRCRNSRACRRRRADTISAYPAHKPRWHSRLSPRSRWYRKGPDIPRASGIVAVNLEWGICFQVYVPSAAACAESLTTTATEPLCRSARPGATEPERGVFHERRGADAARNRPLAVPSTERRAVRCVGRAPRQPGRSVEVDRIFQDFQINRRCRRDLLAGHILGTRRHPFCQPPAAVLRHAERRTGISARAEIRCHSRHRWRDRSPATRQ